MQCLRLTTRNLQTLKYPKDAEEHFEALHKVLAPWVQLASTTKTCYKKFCGPWMENQWIETHLCRRIAPERSPESVWLRTLDLLFPSSCHGLIFWTLIPWNTIRWFIHCGRVWGQMLHTSRFPNSGQAWWAGSTSCLTSVRSWKQFPMCWLWVLRAMDTSLSRIYWESSSFWMDPSSNPWWSGIC